MVKDRLVCIKLLSTGSSMVTDESPPSNRPMYEASFTLPECSIFPGTSKKGLSKSGRWETERYAFDADEDFSRDPSLPGPKGKDLRRGI